MGPSCRYLRGVSAMRGFAGWNGQRLGEAGGPFTRQIRLAGKAIWMGMGERFMANPILPVSAFSTGLRLVRLFEALIEFPEEIFYVWGQGRGLGLASHLILLFPVVSFLQPGQQGSHL